MLHLRTDCPTMLLNGLGESVQSAPEEEQNSVRFLVPFSHYGPENVQK